MDANNPLPPSVANISALLAAIGARVPTETGPGWFRPARPVFAPEVHAAVRSAATEKRARRRDRNIRNAFAMGLNLSAP